MNENAMQKCRTCLRDSTKVFSLNQQATGCAHRKTYAQLIKELTMLECPTGFEHLMPQYLCIFCCHGLTNIYSFIEQARYCNNKLINVISKRLDYIREKAIDATENTMEKVEENVNTDIDDCQTSQNIQNMEYNTKIQQLSISKDSKTHDASEDNEFTDNNLDLESLSHSEITPKRKSLEAQMSTVCPICGKNLSGCDNLTQHIRIQHGIKDSYKLLRKSKSIPRAIYGCKICSCKYTNKYAYLYHLTHEHKHIGEKKVKPIQKTKIMKCHLCDYTARTYAALNYHNRSKHGTEKDKFKCKFCDHMCLKKFDLLAHVKNYHKELIKSLRAEVKNEDIQRITPDHATILDASKLVQIKTEKSVEENEDSSGDEIPSNKKVTKSYCEITDDKEQLSEEEFIRNILNIKKRQIKPSTRSLARRCDECGNVYKNYNALYAHQKHVHISEDKYSLCPHCGKKYKRKTDLRIHIEKAHIPRKSIETEKKPVKVREKRFMCTECSYVCATITILNIHINRHHTGEKPYKCDICFKSFIVPFDLKTHRYLHTGERPYKCPICLKGFRDNSHMVKHKRIHSSERPYKCKECGKSFTQSYNLSVHRRTHLKEKKLNCLICGKVFENRSLLNIHRINEDHHDDVM